VNGAFLTVVVVQLVVNAVLLVYVRAVKKRLDYYAALCEDESLKTADEVLHKITDLKHTLRQLPAALRPEEAARATQKQTRELRDILERALGSAGKER
jgi:hypothetical protein